MKKILVYTKMNFGIPANSGIKKKVFAQAQAFRAHGLEADFLYIEGNSIKIETSTSVHEHKAQGKFDYLTYLYGGFLKDFPIEQYDYIYIRHFLTNPLFLWMLRRIKQKKPSCKIFMEIPTYPYRFEFRDMPLVKRIGLWLDERCVPYFHNYIHRIVTFSAQEKIASIPTIRTDNGIDINQFGLVKQATFDGSSLHLLGLANVQTWHGFDRVIEGLKNYYQTKPAVSVIFHIVGMGSELQMLKDLTAKYGLSDVVKFHGFVTGPELVKLFETCHIGIGSLGMHRINVADGQTSTLKSREYAARGLPFVIGHKDRGFPEGYPFFLELKADEQPIRINQLLDFYKKVQETPNYSMLMHEYARENLTWKVKLANVVKAYLED